MTSSDTDRVYLQFKEESDRAAGVIAAAFLDHELGELLTRFMRDVKETASLFEPTQPLSSFGMKTKFAYTLGLIDERSKDDLDTIRKIRNLFAHDRKPRSFDDSQIASLCGNLKWAKFLIDQGQKLSTTRDRFEGATEALLGAIYAMQHGAHAGKRLSPEQAEWPRDINVDSGKISLSVFIEHKGQKRLPSLAISFAQKSTVNIQWKKVEHVTELIRQLRVCERELSAGSSAKTEARATEGKTGRRSRR